MNTAVPLEEQTNRIEKLLVELSLYPSFSNAAEALDAHNVSASIDEASVSTVAGQVAVATFVVTATRYARGGVTIFGPVTCANLMAQFAELSFSDVLKQLGAHISTEPAPTSACHFGSPSQGSAPRFFVCAGTWWAGISPTDSHADWTQANAITGALAGALASAEFFLQATDPVRPALSALRYIELIEGCGPHGYRGPNIEILPTSIDIFGLGHLGQAYAWVLSCLPYSDRYAVKLHLFDEDRVGISTPSTSVLSSPTHIGKSKARVVADWLEQRGFNTRIIERNVDASFRRAQPGPTFALAGVDNIPGRIAIARAGYELVVDGGIGARAATYDVICVRTFPASIEPEAAWVASSNPTNTILSLPGYRSLQQETGDACGVVRVAQKAAGVPFVGMVTACIAIGQAVKLLHGKGADEVFAVQLRCVDDCDRRKNDNLPDSMSIAFQDVRVR